MRVSLKQSEITQAIAVYLSFKGLSNVQADQLEITYTRVLKGDNQGIVAEVEIPDNGELPKRKTLSELEAERPEDFRNPSDVVKGSRTSGEVGVAGPAATPAAETKQPEVPVEAQQPAGGYTPPAEDLQPETQAPVVEAQPETPAEPVAEQPQDTAKPAEAGSSLFD